MDLGRLLLRLTIGTTFFVHGTQKLRGWFGGYGPDGTGQFFESIGLRPGRDHARRRRRRPRPRAVCSSPSGSRRPRPRPG